MSASVSHTIINSINSVLMWKQLDLEACDLFFPNPNPYIQQCYHNNIIISRSSLICRSLQAIFNYIHIFSAFLLFFSPVLSFHQ